MAIIQHQASSDSDESSTDYASDVSDSLDSTPSPLSTESPMAELSVRTSDVHPRQRACARRKEQQRQRLLRYLVDALCQDEPVVLSQPNASVPRHRPRLVLLGNQNTLILGLVLFDRGATAARDVMGH